MGKQNKRIREAVSKGESGERKTAETITGENRTGKNEEMSQTKKAAENAVNGVKKS